MGYLEGSGKTYEGAAACYDQGSDLRDLSVLTKVYYCEYKFGLTRGQVEASIGARRERFEFVEELVRVCFQGLRDITYFQGGTNGICVSTFFL
jgi:hypothetical protein